MPTATASSRLNNYGNTICDELLYYVSFSDVRGLVNEYDGIDPKTDNADFAIFRKKLIDIEWTPRKADAFMMKWLTYAADRLPEEEEMPFDVALKDRTVDCEEHRTVANALLVLSGYDGEAVDLYYVPDDPEGEAQGHATKIVNWKPTVVTLCNWRLWDHWTDKMDFIRDFIPNANSYDVLNGRWEMGQFVQDYVNENKVLEKTAATDALGTVRINVEKYLPSPLKFDASSLKKADADYMKAFVGHRNYLIEQLKDLEPGATEYGRAARELKVRNKLLRRPLYSRKPIETVC